MSVTKVTTNALIKRINRRLARQGHQLKKLRQWDLNTGLYYVQDIYRNTDVWYHVDPVTFARELGVLAPGEVVADSVEV